MWSAGMVICTGRCADLHMVQMMPLPLTGSCFSKMQIGFTFRCRLTQVVLDRGPLNGCCCCCLWRECLWIIDTGFHNTVTSQSSLSLNQRCYSTGGNLEHWFKVVRKSGGIILSFSVIRPLKKGMLCHLCRSSDPASSALFLVPFHYLFYAVD